MKKQILVKIDKYQQLSDEIKQQVDTFVCNCYGEQNVSPIHSSLLDVTSICMYNDTHLIGYTGIAICELPSMDLRYAALTCFCIEASLRSSGFGSYLLQFCERYLQETRAADVSIFTCHPSLSDFYTLHSHWRPIDLRLRSGRNFDSKKLGLIVLFQSFHPNITEKTFLSLYPEIDLRLPPGIFF